MAIGSKKKVFFFKKRRQRRTFTASSDVRFRRSSLGRRRPTSNAKRCRFIYYFFFTCRCCGCESLGHCDSVKLSPFFFFSPKMILKKFHVESTFRSNGSKKTFGFICFYKNDLHSLSVAKTPFLCHRFSIKNNKQIRLKSLEIFWMQNSNVQ